MSGADVKVEYGPTGLLREHIGAGEPCALLASASRRHLRDLLACDKTASTHTFCWNELSFVSDRAGVWLDLLRDPALRSDALTPDCGPFGDYTQAFFDNMDILEPGPKQQLWTRAAPLVGGRGMVGIPQGGLANTWILRQGLADPLIGYVHYAHALRAMPDVHYVAIPDEHNIRCEYQLAVLDAPNEVTVLAKFILSCAE